MATNIYITNSSAVNFDVSLSANLGPSAVYSNDITLATSAAAPGSTKLFLASVSRGPNNPMDDGTPQVSEIQLYMNGHFIAALQLMMKSDIVPADYLWWAWRTAAQGSDRFTSDRDPHTTQVTADTANFSLTLQAQSTVGFDDIYLSISETGDLPPGADAIYQWLNSIRSMTFAANGSSLLPPGSYNAEISSSLNQFKVQFPINPLGSAGPVALQTTPSVNLNQLTAIYLSVDVPSNNVTVLWTPGQSTITVNNLFQQTVNIGAVVWSSTGPNSPLAVPLSPAWSLLPQDNPVIETLTKRETGQEIVADNSGIGNMGRLVVKVLSDHKDWIKNGMNGLPPAINYLAEFPKNISIQEWRVIVEEAVRRGLNPMGPGFAIGGGWFMVDVISCYADSFFACRHIVYDSERNAIRHAVWQISLVQKFGLAFAQLLGAAHEVGRPGTAHDGEVDEINNKVSQQIALQFPTKDALELAVTAWKNGVLKSYDNEWPKDEL